LFRSGKRHDPAKNKAAAYEVMDTLGQVLGVEVVQTANRIERMTPVATLKPPSV